jgi:hypothetical protein
MAEARLHPRLRLNVTADIIGSEIMLGRSVADISLGGCRLSGEGWEEPGAKMEMVLSFPDQGANVVVNVEVVRSTPRDMGCRFCDLTDDQKWALKKYVRAS